jgi:hypothetical protein
MEERERYYSFVFGVFYFVHIIMSIFTIYDSMLILLNYIALHLHIILYKLVRPLKMRFTVIF